MKKLLVSCLALVAVFGSIPFVGCSDSAKGEQSSHPGASGNPGAGGNPGDGGGAGGACESGSEGCSCYRNDTCDANLTCDKGRCVTGAGGTGGDAAGGATNGGSGTAGGETAVAGGGATGQAGSPSEAGGGAGGAASKPDDCGGAAKNVLDNFFSCDDRICEIDGRGGSWYSYAKIGISNKLTIEANPNGFVNKNCAAAARGAYIGSGTTDPFAGIGFALADQSPYDVSGYTGVQVSIETTEAMYVYVYTADAEFAAPFTQLNNSNKVSIPFTTFTHASGSATLDLTQVEGFKFTPDLTDAATMNDSFNFAVYGVQLY